MRKFASDGLFWLPDHPDDKVAGRLEFDQVRGGELNLIGAFGDIRALTNGSRDYSRIVGVAGKRLLTLEECRQSHRGIESPGLVRQRFRVGFILAGAHFEPGEVLEFTSVAVTIDNIEEWIGQSGFSTEIEQDASTRDLTRITMEYRPIPRESIQFSGGTLELGFTYSFSDDIPRSTKISQGCHFRVRPTALSALKPDLLRYAGALEDLLTLGVGETAFLDEVWLTHPDVAREIAERKYEESIDILLERRETYHEDVRRRLAPEMIFTFDDIGRLEGMARWLDLSQRFRPVLGLLMAPRYMSRMYGENRFLNYVFAAEVFHRAYFDNRVLPKAVFKAKKRRIVRRVPRDQRRWLLEQLNYANEPRLSARLVEMVAHVGMPFAVMVPDPRTWAGAVAKLRNSIAHRGGIETEDDSYRLALHYLGESVAYLTTACLLKELDPSARIVDNLSNHRRFMSVVQQLPEVITAIQSW